MGNPVRVQISPRAPSLICGGSSSFWERTRIISAAVFAPRAVRRRLGDESEEADAEAVLGAHFVLRAAMRATHVRAAGILSPVKNLHRSEQLRAAKALH